MSHWTDPQHRGLYDTPAYRPPYPQPPSSNDLSSRVSRLEVHQFHHTSQSQRIEQESLARARDIAVALTTIQARLGVVETHVGTVKTLVGWMPALAKFSAAAILLSLVLSGRMSVDGAKAFLPAFGLPGG